jgi:protein involved in polysaccharide export with SLBB domain
MKLQRYIVPLGIELSTIRRASVALLAFCLTACDDSAGTTVPASTPDSTALDVAQPAEYRLGLGDKVRIKVYGADQIGGEFEVDLSGSIDAPLLGTLKAAGYTTPELRKQIAQKLKADNIVDNPQVSVDLVAASPFYVLGEVEKSGEYPYHAGLNVVSAIATAGGFRYRANQSKVFIRRRGQQAEIVLPTSSAAPVYPGDIVRVPGRFF